MSFGGGSQNEKGGIGKSKKAGIVFPVGRMHRYMKKGNYAEKIGTGASVYAAAVIEYLVAEVLELAGNAARDNKKGRITPRHLMMAIRNDEELNRLLGSVIISQGGVIPNIEAVLLKKHTSSGPAGGSQQSQSLSQSALKESQKPNKQRVTSKRPVPPAKKSPVTKEPQGNKTRPETVNEASEEESSDAESEEGGENQEAAPNNAQTNETQNATQNNGEQEEGSEEEEREASSPPVPRTTRASSKPPQSKAPQAKPRAKAPAGKGKLPARATAAESQEA
ncbi:hypothetical protein RvY_10340 [Ramazzottius varieornatus]|uniref:Histone H2A n=1 Tax=Ramazzottius varieornatus TaxID=947166 RepID=A0A1D1VCF4_RAMVA|nr:hypothetical protein RvY_10340 [Ramazzottius varieornatus]